MGAHDSLSGPNQVASPDPFERTFGLRDHAGRSEVSAPDFGPEPIELEALDFTLKHGKQNIEAQL